MYMNITHKSTLEKQCSLIGRVNGDTIDEILFFINFHNVIINSLYGQIWLQLLKIGWDLFAEGWEINPIEVGKICDKHTYSCKYRYHYYVT